MNVSSVKNLNGETFSAVQDTFLTNIVSSNSANWNEISAYQANSGSFLTAVPAGTMNETAFEYDANDKISGYNGSAFAGGSDVPEGVMVESGLEYNAVNEISAYNGSAIAQYGVEKQWLQHDDTLCHLSNSAQYALGVNVSALQRLMGIDETVLWEGTAFSPPGSTNPMRASAEMSESIQNFDQIRLDFRGNNYYFNDSVLLTHPYNTTTGTCYVNVKHEQANNSVFIGTLYKWINDTTLSGMCSFGTTQNVTAMTGGYYNYGAVVRVVGIHRISG